MKSVHEILTNSVKEYNVWVSKGRGRYIDPIRQYADLRGVFFNMLCKEIGYHTANPIKEVLVDMPLKRKISPEDIKLNLNDKLYITGLSFTVPNYAGATGVDRRSRILGMLQDEVANIEFVIHSQDIFYKVNDFITDINTYKV